MLRGFGDPSKLLQLMFGCRLSYGMSETAENCVGRVQGLASYCIVILLFLTLGESKLSLKFIVSHSWVRKKNIREMLYDTEGLAIWLQFCTSEQVTQLLYLYATLLWMGNYFRWVFGVKEVFHIEEKKENIILPWKTFFQCVFSYDNEIIVFFGSIKLSLSTDALGTPEWWWYGFFPSQVGKLIRVYKSQWLLVLGLKQLIVQFALQFAFIINVAFFCLVFRVLMLCFYMLFYLICGHCVSKFLNTMFPKVSEKYKR